MYFNVVKFIFVLSKEVKTFSLLRHNGPLKIYQSFTLTAEMMLLEDALTKLHQS
jgi:hypothetical protein